MSAIRVDFSGSEESVGRIAALADTNAVEHTGAMDAGSNVEALNAPITGAEIILAAQVVSAVFKAGAAAVAFIVAVRAALRQGETITIRIGKKRLILTNATADEDVKSVAS